MNADTVIAQQSTTQSFFRELQKIVQDKVLYIVVCGVLVSYFYNLAVVKYSLTGDNEFRLYDILGVFLLFYFYNYNHILKVIIYKIPVYKFLYWLLNWSGVMMLITMIFSLVHGQFWSFLQVFLYWYHFWVFYLAGVFIYLFCLSKSKRNLFIYIILIGSIIESVLVVLQNIGVVPFLWGDIYLKAYSFYSGTLGPNKIVYGMTTFFSLVLAIGILLEKSIKINKIILIVAVLVNLYSVLLSGSRTTYTALAVFLIYFAIFKTAKFIVTSTIFVAMAIFVISYNPQLYDTVSSVVENRVVAKVNNIENPNDKKDAGELYSKLGSGRDKLTKGNFYYILENPIIIPFGMGFVNRFNSAPGLSAHNMYLQVIKELGLVGFFLYFGWLVQYLLIDFKDFSGFSIGLKGFVLSMLVTLFFGEHLYIYRPVFALLGLFLAITSIFISILHKNEK